MADRGESCVLIVLLCGDASIDEPGPTGILGWSALRRQFVRGNVDRTS